MSGKPIAPCMTGLGGAIWRALLGAGSAGATVEELADAGYRGCAAPETYLASVRCQVGRLDRAMAPRGYAIVRTRKQGVLAYAVARVAEPARAGRAG